MITEAVTEERDNPNGIKKTIVISGCGGLKAQGLIKRFKLNYKPVTTSKVRCESTQPPVTDHIPSDSSQFKVDTRNNEQQLVKTTLTET